MPPILDILFVALAVLLAASYLVWRKVRSLRRIERDWSSGRAEVCDHCPAIDIRKAQVRRSSSLPAK
jgi:hypothetical protein